MPDFILDSKSFEILCLKCTGTKDFVQIFPLTILVNFGIYEIISQVLEKSEILYEDTWRYSLLIKKYNPKFNTHNVFWAL